MFYDLTSSYVEGGADWSELLKRGYSRDQRSDCKQIVIGLVVTRQLSRRMAITSCTLMALLAAGVRIAMTMGPAMSRSGGN